MALTADPVIWTDEGPRSSLYGDIYFSPQDGLAESRAVFLQGCGLPGAWAGRRHFTVAELGFGSGLNIAALLQLWDRHRPTGARLHVFSVEAHLMTKENAARALAAWPELAAHAQPLIAAWPAARRGFHRIDAPQFGAVIDIALMEAGEALSEWQGAADAWFLDGFAPSANPAMWRDEVLAMVAARSAPGARAATFTVAGQVRRGLGHCGFVVDKRPGHGRKRERLEARLTGAPPDDGTPGKIVIVGAGIAGASLARAFASEGADVEVMAGAPAPAASGNPAALVTPAFDAGGGDRARLYADAFDRALGLYRTLPEAVLAHGVLQLAQNDRDAARFAAVSGQDVFAPGSLRPLGAPEVEDRLGEPSRTDGLSIDDGLVIEPAAVLGTWLGAEPRTDPVQTIRRGPAGWRLALESGQEIVAETLVLAAGWGARALAPDLDFGAVRGQASWVAHGKAVAPAAFGAYAIPMRGGLLFGATHDRGDTGCDVRPADHERNIKALAQARPVLAASIDSARVEGRAAIRAATADRLPHAGAIAPGLFVLSGLGSRGFTTAPLLAEHVCALALGRPSPLAASLAAMVDPSRRVKKRTAPPSGGAETVDQL